MGPQGFRLGGAQEGLLRAPVGGFSALFLGATAVPQAPGCGIGGLHLFGTHHFAAWLGRRPGVCGPPTELKRILRIGGLIRLEPGSALDKHGLAALRGCLAGDFGRAARALPGGLSCGPDEDCPVGEPAWRCAFSAPIVDPLQCRGVCLAV
ncbi:hypothetical protein NDU88_004508 [Pleurodeles waltl]|uniref:Uncharacterized protein n=1 Tax=Pleurodeles waltl TaxID=8319 RepID=A0AAV7QC83_PLEWA|nr:hypothetical protein NDU88_004508 [Pleurodeles waltl]